MSEHTTFSSEGITHVVIDEMARDAQVWGIADATEIQVTFLSAGSERQSGFDAEGDTLRLRKVWVERINLPAKLSLTIKRASGDLSVRGVAGDLSVEAIQGDLRLGALSGTTRIARVEGDLRADDFADLRLLGDCSGDLRLEGGDTLAAETIAGDVRLADIGDARLARIHGDLWAERLSGGLQVDRVNGDARLSELAGPVNLRVLHGDLRASGLSGGLAAHQVQGDAMLQGPYGSDAAYSLMTHGDISLLLPADTDARLTARANGRIRSEVQLTPAADGSPTFTATMGQGSARINLSSGGDMRVAQSGTTGPRTAADVREPVTPEDLRSLGDRIRQQVTTSLAAAGIMVEGRHGGRGPRPARSERPAAPVAPAAPAAPARPLSFMPPAPPKAPAEEELRILKMVEDGTITAAQAEMLLKALEG
jgi:DUF4097 and DUF4098 domain-containing protein YvlB